MTRPPLPTLVRRALARHALADVPDADLLSRFADRRDPDAFTELVERYAPLVWGVCRRALGPGESAEDAFQATFVTLARKAGTLRRPERLPGWLHGVARRVAWQHKAINARSATGAVPECASRAPSPLEQVSGQELIAAIEEEVDRLPEAYRSAVLLCWFEDCSLEEAARQLGTTKGRLWGWLKRACERLQGRLAHRGYGVPAVLGVGLVAATPASARLIERAIESGLRTPAGAAAGIGAVAMIPAARPLGLAALVAAAVVGLVTLLPAGAPDDPPKDHPKDPPPKVEEKDVGGFPLPAGAVHRFGNRQLRHPDGIHTLVVSPDGKLLATAGGTAVIVWDLRTLHPKCVLRDQSVSGYSPDPGPGRVAFTADSKSLLVVAGLRDGRFVQIGGRAGPTIDVATVFDLDTGKPRLTLKGEADYWLTAWVSAGGKEFAVATRQAVRFYDAKDGKELKKVDLPGQSGGLAWVAPAADRILTQTFREPGNPSPNVFDARTGKELYSPAGIGPAAAFSPDGKVLAVFDPAGKVRIHDVDGQKELYAFDHPGGGQQRGGPMRFAADGRTLFFGGQHGAIYRWNVADNRRLPDVGEHSTWTLSSIALSPDESVLYSTGYDKLIRRWDLKTGKQIPLPEGYITQTTVAPTPDGRHLLVADHGGALDLWDLATGKRAKSIISSVGKHGMDCVAVSDDGRWFAGGRTVQDIRLYDLKAGKEERVIPLVEKPDPRGSDHVKRVGFGPGGKVLYSGSQKTGVTAWEVPTGKQLWRTVGAGPFPAVDPLGRWVASGGGYNSEVIRWTLLDAASGDVVRTVDVTQEPEGQAGGRVQGFEPVYPPYLTDLRFTPDGSHLVTAHYDGTVRVWDPEAGRQVTRLKDTFRGGPAGLACSPDSRWVAVGRADGKIVVWELATEKVVLTLAGHDSGVRDVEFTLDGRGLIGNADLAPILWTLEPKDIPAADSPDALWKDLATDDAGRAYRLQWGLIKDPRAAVQLFADKVKPAELAVPRADFDKWVGNLDSPQFRAREAAERELARAGVRVPVGWLRKAAAEAKSDEQQARLGRVLAARGKPSPDEWRLARAVQVLERAGTAEARALLKAWAAAPDGTQVAVDAKAALGRLARR